MPAAASARTDPGNLYPPAGARSGSPVLVAVGTVVVVVGVVVVVPPSPCFLPRGADDEVLWNLGRLLPCPADAVGHPVLGGLADQEDLPAVVDPEEAEERLPEPSDDNGGKEDPEAPPPEGTGAAVWCLGRGNPGRPPKTMSTRLGCLRLASCDNNICAGVSCHKTHTHTRKQAVRRGRR